MVLSLHQGNIHIKRKLRVWRVQKCMPLVGAKRSLTSAGLQTTLSQAIQYRAEHGNLRKSGCIFGYGTEFAPSIVYIKRKLRVWRVQKCIPLVGAKTVLTCVGLQTVLSHLSQNRVENRN